MEEQSKNDSAKTLHLRERLTLAEAEVKHLKTKLEYYEKIREIEEDTKETHQRNRELFEMIERMERIAHTINSPGKKWYQFWK